MEKKNEELGTKSLRDNDVSRIVFHYGGNLMDLSTQVVTLQLGSGGLDFFTRTAPLESDKRTTGSNEL